MPDFYTPHLLMHLAAVIALAALALREQLKLRLVLLASLMVSATYNVVKTTPDYQAVAWNCVSMAINLRLIIEIVINRTRFGMSEEEQRLFAEFELLSPGEFRSIMKLAYWRTAVEPVILTREGVAPDALFYVIDGGIAIDKADRHFEVSPHTFIGEIAFLRQEAASATVSVSAGARFVEWPIDQLRGRLDGRRPLRQILMRLISVDMAMKVARA